MNSVNLALEALMNSVDLDLQKGQPIKNIGRGFSYVGLCIYGFLAIVATSLVVNPLRNAWKKATVSERNVNGGCHR